MNNGNLHNGYKSEASFKGNTETTHNFSDIAIIGASHAGISFANSLRKNSFSGSLTLIDRQTGGPMERPPLSKGFLLETEDKLNPKYLLKRSKWYRDERVTLKNNVIVKEIDTAKKCLNFVGLIGILYPMSGNVGKKERLAIITTENQIV